MKLSKIMVYQDDNAHCVNWTKYAAHLATQQDAQLTGLFVGPNTSNLGMFDDALQKAIKKNIDQDSQPSSLAKAQFDDTIGKFDIASNFVITNDDPSIALRRKARFYNLVVTGQPDNASSAMQDEKGALSHLLIGSGRPVIVVPRDHAKEPDFSRITIAWDGGRESTRAFFDSLPFLETAESVEVVTIKSDDHSRPFSIAKTDDVTAMLTDLGIKATSKILEAKEKRSGQLILESAQNHQSSLIVMGAYGHSRLREMVLGSATRSLIMNTDIPVFMSH
ncbi:universal stress protein [Terasakiella sp. A23]|uniref:universal stress protein n=1 Tax=Terasakiella sp. FCG-A23 TaxID=3080561 RepID=UPI0029529D2B|nr:universal stress protein [Terasakiella sp. A23]MDV7339166.1 universal stress protein [Terasakiella sp. A23]